MRRIYLLISLAIATCSCTGTGIAPTPETPSHVHANEVKAERQDGISWKQGDELSVFIGVGVTGNQENVPYSYHSDNLFVLSAAVNETEVNQNKCVALFPYDKTAGYDVESDALSVTLPSVQYLEAGEDNTLMVAQSGSPYFHFRPICGMLALQITGEARIKQITMKSEGVCGNGKVSLVDEYPIFAASSQSGNELILDCGETGKELDNIIPELFCIRVPVGKYKSPVFQITDTEGNNFSYSAEDVTVGIYGCSKLKPVRFSTGKSYPTWPDPLMPDKTYLANDKIQIGIDMSRGGGIFHFSEIKTKKNLVNHADAGRLIQQSYYGNSDGSKWGATSWNWNPVQGGGYLYGYDSPVEDCTIGNDFVEVTTIPMHWAKCIVLDECRMTERITLEGDVAHIHFRFVYSGDIMHTSRDQELPAVFCDASLPHFVCYTGTHPWTGDDVTSVIPADLSATGKNEYVTRTEDWAAYVDDSGWGIGLYSPGTMQVTYYRFGTNTAGGGLAPECCYFAPIRKFAVTKGLSYEYDIYVKIGTVSEIRSVFYKLHNR